MSPGAAERECGQAAARHKLGLLDSRPVARRLTEVRLYPGVNSGGIYLC
jgi:hypothetical protein